MDISTLTNPERRAWALFRQRPDLAVAAARRGDQLAAQALREMPIDVLQQAEAVVAASVRTLGDACCDACAHGKPCEGEKPKKACCEACAQGKACTGGCGQTPTTLGAADGRDNWCPPGMVAVRTPAAVPNRFICVTPRYATRDDIPRRADLGAWHPDEIGPPRAGGDDSAYQRYVWERVSRTLSGTDDVDPLVVAADEATRRRNSALGAVAGAVLGTAAAWTTFALLTKRPVVPPAVSKKLRGLVK